MDPRFLLLLLVACCGVSRAGPVLKEYDSWMQELEPEERVREKRKIDLLKHLEDDGAGARKAAALASAESEDAPEGAAGPQPEDRGEDAAEEGKRLKKQVADSLCVQVGNGKTTCGRIVSARGSAARLIGRSDSGLHPDGQGSEHPGKLDKLPTMQPRTFDSLLPLSSLASAVTYAVPTTYAAEPAAALGHSVPIAAAAAAPAVHVAPLAPLAPIAHLEPLSLNLLPHPVPMMHAMLAHHPLVNLQRMELPKLPEVIYAPAEVKQPTYEVKPIVAARPIATAPYLYPSRYGAIKNGFDGPMICHPYDEKLSQQVIQIRPEVHVIESGQAKANSSAEEFKSQSGDASDETEKIHDHLRKVSKIHEDIMQLNKVAQRMIDQQERLAEMQQRHLWKTDEKLSSAGQLSPLRMIMVPPTYSRANALAYPTSGDDIEFFINLLKAGKKFGALSESLQPAIAAALETTQLLGGKQDGQIGGSQSSSGVGGKQTSGPAQTSGAKTDK